MKHALTSIAICLALLVPGIASAKKPAPTTCELLLAPDPDYIYTGTPFTVKLVRVPSYPGAFRHPTVSIDVTYPMPSGSEVTQNYTHSIAAFNVTYVEANFSTPPLSSGILPFQKAKIAATVAEPVGKNNKRKRKITSCKTTATVLQAN